VQAGVERVEVRILMLGTQIPLPSDVEVDLLNPPVVNQRRREI
jgi:hypothetical protein